MALPEPTQGLVISYSYLWRHERTAGLTEGVKDRPCAIVLVVEDKDNGAKTVTVAPITHSPPRDPKMAIEIPARVKAHLSLDAARSWIALDEFNEFLWPGFDLRPISGNPSRYEYGLLPPVLFAKMTNLVLELRTSGKAFSASREEG
jgi:PemK-like, MazF-like toxin of type II toxin-antitoxin system